ncbi:MAG: HD-GYP domain-containing protein (c-di-GMP phosphodiesterase class II) [Planctomycetota bacterium]|jgi:HD-GYP domain-containing protein (c-di-GMP phosphodiesterase class II)
MTSRILLALAPERASRPLYSAIQSAGFASTVLPDSSQPLAGLADAPPAAVIVLDAELLGAQLSAVLTELREQRPLLCFALVGEAKASAVAGIEVRCLATAEDGPRAREIIELAVGDHRAHRARSFYSAVDEDAQAFDESTVRRLYALTRKLSAGEDLAGLAQTAADTLVKLLPERGVHVQLWDQDQPGGGADVSAGPEMGSGLYRLPLESGRGRVGEIVVDGKCGDEHGMSEAHETLLAAVAAPLASAAEAEVQRVERQRAQEATLLAMARIADMRDGETGAHLSRVAHYSVLVAEALRDDGHYQSEISSDFLVDLMRCAPLHDLGKVAVPDAILLKAGRLSPMEWELMKSHSEVGAEILSQLMRENPVLGFVSMGSDIARSHHERWDGSGYPSGLAGEAIPLSGRIVALADLYDALTSERSYKQAWTHAKAMEHLRGLSGTHLDPHALKAFLSRADEVDQIRQRFVDDPLADSDDSTFAA